MPRESWPVWMVERMAPGLATVVSWPAPEQLNIGGRIGPTAKIMIRRASVGTSAGRAAESTDESTTSGADRRWTQPASPGWKALSNGLRQPVFSELCGNGVAERRVGRPGRHVADENAQRTFKRVFVATGQRDQFRGIGYWSVDEGDEIVQRFGVAWRRLANAAGIWGGLAGTANGTGVGGGGVVGGTGMGGNSLYRTEGQERDRAGSRVAGPGAADAAEDVQAAQSS